MSVRRTSGPPDDRSPDPFGTTQGVDENSRPPSGNHELDQTHVIHPNDTKSTRAPVAEGSNGSSSRRNVVGGGAKQDGGGGKTRTVADLRAARESRANEALKMKDEQLRILQDQNNQLLGNLDRCVAYMSLVLVLAFAGDFSYSLVVVCRLFRVRP